MSELKRPCENCPWRLSNQGKRTPWGFYTKRNLRRLWNQIRGGGQPQSCHPTDPNHPDHIAAGAKEGAEAQECPGSVILVLREAQRIASYSEDGTTVSPESIDAYLADQRNRRFGLKKSGMMYWLISRIQMAGVPMLGDAPLPNVDVDDEEIGIGFLEPKEEA